ncbi:MAG: hypothetical protein IJO72_02440 [Oscillospiraceae bacterium]|nr:hypothetical protein [Oscillospiraceae bacterium]
MQLIQNIFNFDEIGGKIKGVAKWLCWIGILLTWIGAGIAFVICLFMEGMFLVALLVPVIAALYSGLIWIGSWMMYAFGEVVETICSIFLDVDSLKELLQNKGKDTPAPVVEGGKISNHRQTRVPVTAGGWTCSCGRRHMPYETSCVCGKVKADGQKTQEPVAAGGWTCSCGRNHMPYETSCVCGKTKAEVQNK